MLGDLMVGCRSVTVKGWYGLERATRVGSTSAGGERGEASRCAQGCRGGIPRVRRRPCSNHPGSSHLALAGKEPRPLHHGPTASGPKLPGWLGRSQPAKSGRCMTCETIRKSWSTSPFAGTTQRRTSDQNWSGSKRNSGKSSKTGFNHSERSVPDPSTAVLRGKESRPPGSPHIQTL